MIVTFCDICGGALTGNNNGEASFAGNALARRHVDLCRECLTKIRLLLDHAKPITWNVTVALKD